VSEKKHRGRGPVYAGALSTSLLGQTGEKESNVKLGLNQLPSESF